VTEDRSVLSRAARRPDRCYSYGSHVDNAVDLWVPKVEWDAEGRHPLVVMIHGGFWRPEYDRSHVAPLCAAVADLGCAAVAIEYRRTPGSPDETVGDVAAALRWIGSSEALAPYRDAGGLVIGHSAGGHLALWSASALELPWRRASIVLAPVADLVSAETEDLDEGAVVAFLGTSASRRPDLDPIRLGDPQGELHLIHGTSDERVPFSQSEAYVDAHRTAVLHRLDGIGHFALIDPLSDAWRSVAALLASVMRT
jgi:acetyl esterase/lipase